MGMEETRRTLTWPGPRSTLRVQGARCCRRVMFSGLLGQVLMDCLSQASPVGKRNSCSFALITQLGGNLGFSRGDIHIRGSWVTY